MYGSGKVGQDLISNRVLALQPSHYYPFYQDTLSEGDPLVLAEHWSQKDPPIIAGGFLQHLGYPV
jgi:hypothetical protein